MRYSTCIIKNPTGTFMLAGSVPLELTVEAGGAFPHRNSKIWQTEKEVISDLLKIGITEFQLENCAWYKP